MYDKLVDDDAPLIKCHFKCDVRKTTPEWDLLISPTTAGQKAMVDEEAVMDSKQFR